MVNKYDYITLFIPDSETGPRIYMGYIICVSNHIVIGVILQLILKQQQGTVHVAGLIWSVCGRAASISKWFIMHFFTFIFCIIPVIFTKNSTVLSWDLGVIYEKQSHDNNSSILICQFCLFSAKPSPKLMLINWKLGLNVASKMVAIWFWPQCVHVTNIKYTIWSINQRANCTVGHVIVHSLTWLWNDIHLHGQ